MSTTNKKLESDAVAPDDLAQLLKDDKTPWYQKKNLRFLYLTLVPAAIGVEMTSGYDGSVLNGLQAVPRWNEDFGYPQGALLGVISAMYNIGSVSGIPIIPFVNDRWGRRVCVILGSIIIAIGVVIQTAAINVPMLIVSRFLVGFGAPIAITGASQLVSELAYPKERAVIVGLLHESWYAGSVVAAGVTLSTYNWPGDWSWRLPTLFQILPSMLQLVFIWFIPESPRYLVAQDRHEEALNIIVKYHAEGDENSVFAAAEFAQIQQTILSEKEETASPWKSLFTTKVNLHRVLIAACVGLFAQWAGNGLVSYYLTKVLASIGIKNSRTQIQINVGLNCWNLLTGIGGSMMQHYVRRRTQYLTSFGGMTIVYACWTAASSVFVKDNSNDAASKAVVALIFVYYGFYNIMMPLAYAYTIEVFPYLQRSKGMSIMLFMSRMGSFFNTFINPIGLANIGWKMYIVYTCILGIETTVIYFVYPETFGLSLEDAAKSLEGKKADFVVPGSKIVDEDQEKSGSAVAVEKA